MSDDKKIDPEAVKKYAEALETHYLSKDLPKALELYAVIEAKHAESQEAAYSRAQLHNIVKSAVPKEVLLAAQVELARTHLKEV